MSHRYRTVAALMLTTCVASCGDSNPLVGKWDPANTTEAEACPKILEMTDKSYRSDKGVWLYTLVEDGDDVYIIDRKRAETIEAAVKKANALTLTIGKDQCEMQRRKGD